MTDRELLEQIALELGILKNETGSVKDEIAGIQAHLENVTDKKLQMIAESQSNLINKLDEMIYNNERG